MKKITLLLFCLSFNLMIQSQTTLSQSTSQIVVDGAVACANNAGGFTTENNYSRSYIPSDLGQTGTISLIGGEFGVSFNDNGGNNPTVPVVVTAYSTDAPYPTGTLTALTSATVDVTVANNLTVVAFNFDTPVTVDAADEVVIIMAIPDGSTDVFDLRVGQNADGETAPGYISTDVSCGPIAPTTFDNIGFPGNIILNLVVDVTASIADNNIEGFSFSPNPSTDFVNLRALSNIDNVEVYNALGQKVLNQPFSSNEGVLNISNLNPGFYIMKVKVENQVASYQIVKK